MAVANLSINLAGQLLARPATCNGAGNEGGSGPVFQLGLLTGNKSAAAEISQTATTIDSALAFEALPFQSNFRARLLYLRTKDLAAFDLRLTYEGSGIVTIPLRGTVLLETPADDRLSLVELQGQGSLEWFAAGDLV